MEGSSQEFPRSPASPGFSCHQVLPPVPFNASFCKLPRSLSPCLQQSTLVPLGHFYYWAFFTVPNSQASLGSHSLWSISFITSLVSPSSACCWTRTGKGKDAQEPQSHLPQTTSLLSRGCKAVVTWAVILDLCPSRFFFSAYLSRSGHICWICQHARYSSCQRDTFMLTLHLFWFYIQRVVGMEVMDSARSGAKPGCSKLIHQNFKSKLELAERV